MYTEGLSIIIPTYNEVNSVTSLIKRIVTTMEFAAIPYEIIFIDDHSTDNTRARIKRHVNYHHPIQVFPKEGKKGKGFSIIEGYRHAKYSYIAMLDADLQYPPEILSELYVKARTHGFAVANRRSYRGTRLRTFASRANALIFGKLLLGLPTDVQSGLKVFPREVFDHVDLSLISAWAIDIPLVFTAYDLGYNVGHVDIDFTPRMNGSSQVKFLSTAWEIAYGAIKTKLAKKRIYPLSPTQENPVFGSEIAYQRKRFITHSMLPVRESALITLTGWQKIFLITLIAAFTAGVILRPLPTVIAFVAILSAIYFIDVLFNLSVILKSLHFPPEMIIDDAELRKIDESTLPVYSILCPLYRETEVLPQFIDAMDAIDWPKDKLDVQLLLEEDDSRTIDAARALTLPPYIRVVIVPHSLPKTKPKAANYGLIQAKGEYIVVYDAEDKPDPLQLKKAFVAFHKSSSRVICLQAKLNYYNPRHNLLTRLFTAEYSLWFDVVLPGLQSIGTTIPLGGTSNHFRTHDLLALHGWDPFNVTEDCDLGVRLFKAGYKTAIIDSTTLEEANSNLKNWFRQRSRWIKGYFQTYFVHTRNPVQFTRIYREHSFVFQMVVGGKIAFMLINPILWIVTVSYFVLYRYVGPTIESVYPTWIFYMAAFSLVFGNFIYLYNYMIGLAKRGQWDLIKYIYLVPFYWIMISWGAVIALWQLLVKPYYWEKTIHGFHIGLDAADKQRERMKMANARARTKRFQRIADFAGSTLVSSGILVTASLIGNILNFFYNIYLGRVVSLEQFGVISLIGSFIYISQVPLGALSRAVTHKSAYLLGAYGTPIKEFWGTIRKKSYVWATLLSLIWLVSVPALKIFFKTSDTVPFLLFTPVWFISTLAAVDSGFLGGILNFNILAILAISEASAKLVFSYVFITWGLGAYVYGAIPLSMLVSFSIGWFAASRTKEKVLPATTLLPFLDFPNKFFGTSLLMTVTGITYLSFDVLLAKHFLSPREAGEYSFLSLIGKMVFLLGSLFNGFIVPFVSRDLGAGKRSEKNFLRFIVIILGAHLLAYLGFGVFGYITVPILWGAKSVSVIPYLPSYALAMIAFSLSGTIITYHQVRGEHTFPIAGFILGFIEIAGILIFHTSITQISTVAMISGCIMLVSIVLLDRFYTLIIPIYRNALDFLGLFGRLPVAEQLPDNKLRILIFNWRDMRHTWAGGAEVYIHELAKRWVTLGNEVTVFCGNDGTCPEHETINGTRIIRRGGFYMVYFWAFLYYQRFFKNYFDVIIDSENGLPFFTPLYVKEKVFLLIHHVHQEVFRMRLHPPLSWIGQALERYLMPMVYRNTEVITVSPSSKADILDNKLTKREPYIIYNGVDLRLCKPGAKSKNPMILYLGRLTSMKSLPVLIRSAKHIIKHIPHVQIIIAGDGPDRENLQKLVKKFNLNKHISFKGHVSETEKVTLYQKAWVFVNPSLIEGWGITTIEANACGTPVVASNVQGLRDAVHNPHSGLLVPYGNSDELAKNVIRLLKDTKLRNRMSRESISWASKFQWDKSAYDALQIFLRKKI